MNKETKKLLDQAMKLGFLHNYTEVPSEDTVLQDLLNAMLNVEKGEALLSNFEEQDEMTAAERQVYDWTSCYVYLCHAICEVLDYYKNESKKK